MCAFARWWFQIVCYFHPLEFHDPIWRWVWEKPPTSICIIDFEATKPLHAFSSCIAFSEFLLKWFGDARWSNFKKKHPPRKLAAKLSRKIIRKNWPQVTDMNHLALTQLHQLSEPFWHVSFRECKVAEGFSQICELISHALVPWVLKDLVFSWHF